MSTSYEQQQLLSVLEDTANHLQKAQVNLKKCPKARLTKGYIEARLKIIEDYWATFRAAHENLVKITTKEQKDKTPYFVHEEFFIYEDLYSTIQGDLKDMYQPFLDCSLVNTSVNATTPHNNIHLPKIKIPTFNSLYEGWPAFKDLFTSLVHENTSFSDVQKLHYLKTSITGEAEALLRHIQVTSDNYATAWEILNARYGNKRLIINCILRRLFNIKKMTAQSPTQLKTLLDTTSECLYSLENLSIQTRSWDLIIIYHLVQKLDPETHRNWEEHVNRDKIDALPTWTEFKRFMEAKFRTLELVAAGTNRETKMYVKERTCHFSTSTLKEKACILCNENHTLCHCKSFIKMDPQERSEYIKNKQLCYNFLAPGHTVAKCRLSMSCRICHRRHHSLLHENKKTEPAVSTSTLQPLVSQHVVDEKEEVQVNTMIASHLSTRQTTALLATAVVEGINESGHNILLRVLIDQGSQASFLSENAAQQLQLTRQKVRGSVVGVGSTKTDIKHLVQLQIGSQWDKSFRLPIQAYIMSKQLTSMIPAKTIPTQPWPHIKGLKLADSFYFERGSIDLLLGVKEYAQIIQQDLIKGPPGTPCAQKTSLGWILFGDININQKEDTYLAMHHQVDIDEMLKSIWEIEIDSNRHLTREEKRCEDIYENTTIRNEEGRYIVKLPFKNDSPKIVEGNTKEIATKRFYQLERRFKRSPELKTEYTKVINDYIKQGHMEIIPENEKETQGVYLPHHAVVRNDKETSRTRVVFDASCHTTTKNSNKLISLNEELLVGPQLQDDLRNLLIRWRMKRICFMADIQQMYRQILVNKTDTNFQRIIWRENESDNLQEYRLLRVTFGTAPAPYLAVKTLHQVANDEGADKPQIVCSIQNNFYMDDWLDGADEVEEAKTLAQDVSYILQKGGFNLTKWSSNNVDFLKFIDQDKRSANAHIDMNLDGTIKALGIIWNLSTDTFQYNLNTPTFKGPISKRSILSDLQKLFDPLGWIAPSTVMAKMLIQALWLEKLTWDEEVSESLQEQWRLIKTDLANVNDIQMKRWIGTTKSNMKNIQIHGYSDASIRAYAAAVYIRTETLDQRIITRLIAAKTRVAPLKTISLPRLELCGALLLSRLMKQVGEAMKIPSSDMYAWTDSSIVIAWLCGEPNRWKTFVANRVVEIVENLNNKCWFHVQSSENPADLASRGMLLSDLKTCDLWWKGPSWLSEKTIKFIKQDIIQTEMEMKTIKINTHLVTENKLEKEKSMTEEFDNFDNLTELLTAITYCKRFLNYKKNKSTNRDITVQELDQALTICIKKVQNEEFKEEIQKLKSDKPVKQRSPLRFLNPFLDENQLLRVGGRLRHSDLSDDKKHPIILGKNNKLTPLIIADAHSKTLHGGVQLMLCYLHAKYWIINAKSMVKKHIHKCLICAKLSATSKAQVMGDLPKERVTPSRPFIHSGVDFAGPFQILMSRGRGNRTTKAYVAIFICLSSKAIHIELVGSLSAQCYIGAFRRFVARRGRVSHLWSDQGRNFVGGNRELQEAFDEAKLQFTGEIAQTLAADGTQWHFIPAYSPSFGGLWEAGVKSIKYHLKRVLTANLTFEEMTTVLSQVEACLNSRPLCPIDNTDPDNTDPLTPGHFLIGEAPIVVPSPDMRDMKISHLTRWKYTQKLLNDFWKRWQIEYLSRLQQRPKWLKKEEEFKIGDIVLIKTDNLPPGKWALGRIIEKHPGMDNITRVYSVKSGSSVTKRTVTKLCALPIDTT